MATISEIKKKVDVARKGVEQAVAKAILDNEQEILDLVRIDQLFKKGIDGLGRPITPEYKPFTIDRKSRLGQEINHVTLRDTGAFYRAFTTDYGSSKLEIFSTDSKATSLETKYGDDIYGMTKENQRKLSEKIIVPSLRAYLKSIFK